MLPIPIGHWVLAIGNICSLTTFPRGVVSDAVPCLFNGVICDLPFNVVGLPKGMGGMIAHPSAICQPPTRRFESQPPQWRRACWGRCRLSRSGRTAGTSSIASGFAAFPAAVEANGASIVATHVAATASLLMSIAVFLFLFCQVCRSCSIYANAVDSHRRAGGSLLALGGHDAQAHSMRAVGEIIGQ